MAYAAARRKRDGQYGREKFYSLVIHGCPRITGSLLRTGPTKFGRENALCVTRREKILVIGAVSFQVSGAFPTAWYPEVFLFALAPKHPSYPFTIPFVRAVRRCFRSLLLLASMSRIRRTFVCESNGRTGSELTRKFRVA